MAAAISTKLPARKPVMKLSDILHELQQIERTHDLSR